jgi:YbgC/YbaW family acyl-CoA thioester hydrolase
MPYEFHHPRRVEFADTDMAGVIHFTSFFRYMEETEHAFWRSLGLTVVMRRDGEVVSWPRVAAACDFLRPVFFEDELDVHLWVAHKGHKSLRFCAAFSLAKPGRLTADVGDGHKRELLVARGRISVACCICRPGHPLESIAIPEDLASRIEVAPYGDLPGHWSRAGSTP